MSEYTGYRDKNGRKIMSDDIVTAYDRDYEICKSDWSGAWMLDNPSGRVTLAEYCDEVEVKDVRISLVYSDKSGEYYISVNGNVYMDSYEIENRDGDVFDVYREVIENTDKAKDFIRK